MNPEKRFQKIRHQALKQAVKARKGYIAKVIVEAAAIFEDYLRKGLQSSDQEQPTRQYLEHGMSEDRDENDNRSRSGE